MRAEGRKCFFLLGFLKIWPPSVSKNWPSSALLPSAERVLSLLSGPSSFTLSAFTLLPAAASVLFPGNNPAQKGNYEITYPLKYFVSLHPTSTGRHLLSNGNFQRAVPACAIPPAGITWAVLQ